MTLLFLCSCYTRTENQKTTDSGTIIDTFMYNGQTIHLHPIDKAELMKLPDNLSIDHSLMMERLVETIDDTANVYRHDSTLVLKFENGASVKLISSQSGNKLLTYDYIEDIKSLNCYMTECVWDVNLRFSFWNKKTGKETNVYSYPLESPNGKRIICFDRFLPTFKLCVSDILSRKGWTTFEMD